MNWYIRWKYWDRLDITIYEMLGNEQASNKILYRWRLQCRQQLEVRQRQEQGLEAQGRMYRVIL